MKLSDSYLIFRWWVAGHSLQHFNIPVSNTLLNDSKQCVQKLRSVLRFLLGAIHNIENIITYENSVKLYNIDKYILHLLYIFNQEVIFFIIWLYFVLFIYFWHIH